MQHELGPDDHEGMLMAPSLKRRRVLMETAQSAWHGHKWSTWCFLHSFSTPANCGVDWPSQF
jgi:hypothetical protein